MGETANVRYLLFLMPTPVQNQKLFRTNAPAEKATPCMKRAHARRDVPAGFRRLRVVGAAIVALTGLLVGGAAAASSDVRGEAVTHRSPDGVEERCVMLARLPGGVARRDDPAIRAGRGGAGDPDVRTDSHRPRVADDRLPGRSGRDIDARVHFFSFPR